MGRRSRKRRDPRPPSQRGQTPHPRGDARGQTPPPRGDSRGQTPSVGGTQISRSEARNEAIRQSLEPLGPGERPGAVTVAAVVAAILLVANVGLWLAGVEVSGREPTAGSVVLQGVVLAVAAAGMWKAKYWAVLGFQALLGLSILLAALGLMVANEVAEVVFCLAIIGLGGWLFWKLIRALARLQMPVRRPQRSDG